ncbi:hypothetical protein [Bradyrhizobium australiense]|uniref:Uncharacterized protein n=1 Tax=Bradyrhizobium australiense TaxID=2721161 RepID=A0A7Y4GQT1_9BRAD|nr:hypothetical protein [Bradyrhizobium australiense]NOJ40136.1 hypothetical protein [Bradyrhizobium australiense]
MIAMEERFGKLADATLLAEGIITDDDSRWKLIEALARDLTPAAKKLARNSEDAGQDEERYVEACADPGSPVRTSLTTILRWECEKTRTSSTSENDRSVIVRPQADDSPLM